MTLTTKFIACNDSRITSACEGFGAGFPHVGLKQVGVDLGYGAVGSTFSITNVYSEVVKAWNGGPSVIGWLVTVETR